MSHTIASIIDGRFPLFDFNGKLQEPTRHQELILPSQYKDRLTIYGLSDDTMKNLMPNFRKVVERNRGSKKICEVSEFLQPLINAIQSGLPIDDFLKIDPIVRVQVPIISAWFGRDILLAMKLFFPSLSSNGEHYFGSIRDNGSFASIEMTVGEFLYEHIHISQNAGICRQWIADSPVSRISFIHQLGSLMKDCLHFKESIFLLLWNLSANEIKAIKDSYNGDIRCSAELTDEGRQVLSVMEDVFLKKDGGLLTQMTTFMKIHAVTFRRILWTYSGYRKVYIK